MNQKGIVVIIPPAVWIAGLIATLLAGGVAANALGIFGVARVGENCGLPLPTPCQEGSICNNGVCTATVGGGVDRFLFDFSLSNLICRGNLFQEASCNLIIGFAGAIILGSLFALFVILWLGAVPPTALLAIPFIFGAGLGFILTALINTWWWAILIVGIILFIVAVRLKVLN